METLTDSFGRKISYLRVSVTDRCNQRCFYCMPDSGVALFNHNDILSYEEILRIIRVAADEGITKVRITGGEPLIRRQICKLIEKIIQIPGILDVSMTTNGALLKEMARPLFDAGMRRINISLDTLDRDKYEQITKKNHFHRVWEGIEAVEALKFNPVKLNVVVIRGINDNEISEFAKLTFSKPYHVRFIEFMPVGQHNQWSYEKVVPAEEIIKRTESIGPLIPIQKSNLDGPSRRYFFDGALGEIGVISAFSEHFCEKCNRLRLTPDGKLRPCLLSDEEIDIKTHLRDGSSDKTLATILQQAIGKKPQGSHLRQQHDSRCLRNMSRIGG